MTKKTTPLTQIAPSPQNIFNVFGQEYIGKKLTKIKIKKLKIVFFGSRGFVIPVAEAVKDNFDLVAIVTVPDQPFGRGYGLAPTPVKSKFLNSKIPIFDDQNLGDEFGKKIRDLDPDLFIVAAYGKLIPDQVLNIPKLGAINLHPSLLPKYRGPSPIQNALLNGDKETGMTYMVLDQKMDHGPIIFQTRFSILNQDTFETLGNKIFQRAGKEIVGLIEHFTKGLLKPTEQDHSKSTFTKLIKKEDGYFEIDNPPPPEKLDRMIRAYYPWPAAWTKWNDKIVKLLPENMVQMEGKKAVSLKDFLNGYPDFPIRF